MTVFDRIVIGAGFAGLLAAWRAVERGERVCVIEAAPQPGGVLAPIDFGGVRIDAGAESFSTADIHFERLLGELNLTNRIIAPARSDARIIGAENDSYAIPFGYLGIPASLDDPELTAIISPAALAQARHLDSLAATDSRGLSVASLVEQRLGEEFVAKLVNPVFAGVHGAPANTLDVEASAPALISAYRHEGSLVKAAAKIRSGQPRPGAAVASVIGGMFSVIEALVEKLEQADVQFRFSQPVTELTIEDGWVGRTERDEFTARNLSLCAGVDPCTALLSSLEPSLPTVSAGATTANLVFAHVRSTQLDAHPLGSGALVASMSGHDIKATTHVNAKWEWVNDLLLPHEHLIRLSYHDAIDADSTPLDERALRDIERLYEAHDLSIVATAVRTWPSALAQPSPELREARDRTLATASQFDIELCGAITAGNGLLGITKDHYKRKTP